MNERLGIQLDIQPVNKRQVYLQAVCAPIPPLHSIERESLRTGVSLSTIISNNQKLVNAQ